MKMDHRAFERQVRAAARPLPQRSGTRAQLGLVIAALLAAALTVAVSAERHPLPQHRSPSLIA